MPFFHRPPRESRPTLPGAGRAARPAPLSPGDVGYAVVDLETTGLSPTTDAIVEIGLALTESDGTVVATWSTLLDPGRGVGPTYIHGITDNDVVGAPHLDEVADLFARSLAGRVVVAHNARFDLGFLVQALGTRGLLARGAMVPRVCTMEWSRHFLDTPSRRLTTCCEVAGIELGHHHSALDDALASAALLHHYLDLCDGAPPWERVRADAADFTGWHWDDAAADGALALLQPRGQEPARRGETARGGVLERAHFRRLARQAWVDATITDEEWGDLLSEAHRLGLGDDEAAEIVRAARIVPVRR